VLVEDAKYAEVVEDVEVAQREKRDKKRKDD
jgi:hypothetical protein